MMTRKYILAAVSVTIVLILLLAVTIVSSIA